MSYPRSQRRKRGSKALGEADALALACGPRHVRRADRSTGVGRNGGQGGRKERLMMKALTLAVALFTAAAALKTVACRAIDLV